ncbi:MAG: hypothetical protein SFU56_20600 [Capsulimonadales bacterium]|nr:hypothetical protein [Capsulimonadales bacterium]
MERGTSQPVAEMSAVDTGTPAETESLYGAVSIGTIWQFVILHRRERHFVQDVTLYRVPDERHDLCRVVIGILGLSPEAH